MKLTDLKDQGPARTASRRRAPVLWPWLMVVAAWTVALLAALTHQNYLIDHYYLLEESHLPILVALPVFLACWQVMTVGIDALTATFPREGKQWGNSVNAPGPGLIAIQSNTGSMQPSVEEKRDKYE